MLSCLYQMFTLNKKLTWFLPKYGKTRDSNWMTLNLTFKYCVPQGRHSHSSVKEILKVVRHGKIIPKMVKNKDFIIWLLFHPPLVTKYLVELVIWQHMLGLQTCISFAKLPKNSLSSSQSHLNMSHVDLWHDMFHECNRLLT